MHEYKFNSALSAYYKGQHPQAIHLLKELLSEQPNEAEYHALLAACLLDTKRLYACEYELNSALQLSPGNTFAKLTNARLQIFKKKLNLALKICDEVLGQDAESIDALLLKAQVFSLQKKHDDEKAHLQQAVALAPDSARVLCAMGEYYHSVGKLEDATSYAKSALNMSAEDESANVLIGEISLEKGDIEAAEYHAKFAIMINPTSDAALSLFSNIKVRQNLILGLWWRLNSKLTKFGNVKSSLILILGYLIFNLVSQLLLDFNFPIAAKLTSYAWLAIVIYSWVCLPIYYKKLNEELRSFRFNPNF